MRIIQKKYPCTGQMLDGKAALKIDFEKGEDVPTPAEDIAEFAASMENITKLAAEVSTANEKTKNLKAKILNGNEKADSFITLKYVVD